MEPEFRDTVPPHRVGPALVLALALVLLGAATACSQSPQPVTRAAGAKAPAQGAAGAGAAIPRSSEAEPKSVVAARPTSPSPATPATPATPVIGAPASAPATVDPPVSAAPPLVSGTQPVAEGAPAGSAVGASAAGALAPAKASAAVTPVPPPVPGTKTATSDPAVVVVDQAESDPDSQLTLAEAAKAERERKAQAARPRIVINNKTLHRYAKGGQLTVAEPKKKAAATAQGAAAAAAERDEQYWRGRALEIRQRWRKAVDRIKELEQDVSDWRRRFYAQDDPYVRDGQIKPAWDRALDELRESRAGAQAAKKELAEFLEQGRVAGALPGWLREGIEQEPKEEKPVDPTQPIETPIYKDNGR
jgi:hypothetical protein